MMLGGISGLICETVRVYLKFVNGYNFFFLCDSKLYHVLYPS